MARKAARTRKVLKKDVAYCEAKVVDEGPRSSGHRAGSLREDSGLLLGVFPAHPNFTHADFFKWGKIFVNQWLEKK